MILLNDDEIGHLVNEGLMTVHSYIAIGQMVARAQLKKVFNWGYESCPHAGFVNDNPLLRKKDCYTCWQALLKEVE